MAGAVAAGALRVLARGLRLTLSLSFAGAASLAFAAPPPINIPAPSDDGSPQASPGIMGFMNGINRSPQLLGDMWGLRSALSKHGITFAVQETSEMLGNVSGGTKRGAKYDGLTQYLLQMDTQRAFGHYGGLFNVSVLNLHGSNVSSSNLQTLQTASGIEGDRATRLWELWYDQKLLDEDRLSVRIGQQSIDQEFMVSTNALLFVNTMFGWPMLPSANMPAGGPAYPLSAPGIRLKYTPINGITLLGGLYTGDPVRHDDGSDSQLQNRHGTQFPLRGGTLAIAEAQFSYPAPGAMVEPGQADPLGWTYRVGFWHNTRSFNDQRLDTQGLPLANPMSNGDPQQRRDNYAWYAVADRLMWRDDEDPNHTVSGFLRVMGTPLKGRNLISSSINVGLTVHSPFRYRTDDTFGLGMGYASVSSQATAADQDNIVYGNVPGGPVRTHETFIEATYQYQLRPWIQLQPDIQYVWRPGAGVADPANPLHRIKNELVLGMRVNVSF